MTYYNETKKELEDLKYSIRREKTSLEEMVKIEKDSLDKKIELKELLKIGIEKMAKERQMGFPWLAKAYDDLFALEEKFITEYLVKKSNPAIRTSEIVREYSQARRKAEYEKKIAQYLVNYYESIAPFLVDLKEEVEIKEYDQKLLEDYKEEELLDEVTNYLTIEEYRSLPSVERNQKALDRFWSRPMPKWLIGKLYERYVGQMYEELGYEVDYVGIFKGFEDLGRDLICQKGNELIVIQCKNWSQFKTIYEKHIFQFFGTVFQYKDEHRDKSVKAIFYTTTKLSDLARRFAQELGIELKENFPFRKDYPCIKCNISTLEGTKIYHLPFDQQYDKTKIEKQKGEFYCTSVKEAENAGFRRAYRHKVNNT